ncbi:UNVERIFIED_CONTAM: hypothetical protein NCL1_24177 [Trichonephila clavipes]
MEKKPLDLMYFILLPFNIVKASEPKLLNFFDIPINLLSILCFMKLNPKNLVGSMNHGGGSALAWGCKSTSELKGRIGIEKLYFSSSKAHVNHLFITATSLELTF